MVKSEEFGSIIRCIVNGCSSVFTPSSPIIFHCIPKNAERRQTWLSQLSLDDIYNGKARVCSLHFRKEDYVSLGSSCLKSVATPLRWVQHQAHVIVVSNTNDQSPAETSLAQKSIETENGSVHVASQNDSLNSLVLRDAEVDQVCRACLAAGRGALALRGALREAYEQLSGEPLSAQPSFPRRLCSECGARVLAAARFRHKARRAHRLLAALCAVSGHITLRDIASIDRRQHNLESQLSCKHFDANAYQVHVSESQAQINDETEEIYEDLNEEIVEEVEDVVGSGTEEIYEFQEDEIFEDEIDNIGGGEDIDCESINCKNNDRDNDDVIENGDSGVRSNTNKIIKGADNSEVHSKDVFESDDSDDVDLMDVLNEVMNSKTDEDEDKVKCKTKVKKKTTKKKNAKGEKRKKRLLNQEDYLHTASIMNRFRAVLRRKGLEDFIVTKLSFDEQVAEVQSRRESSNYKNAVHKCGVCYRGFYDKRTYDAHALKHTEKYGEFECNICKCRYASILYLQRHVAVNHKARYSCKLCSFVTQCIGVAVLHSKYHAGTTYQCPHCPQQFDKSTSYYGHVRYKHPCALPCPLCGHTFASQRGMEKHKKTIHLFAETETLEGPHCDTCDVTFASQDAHDKHLKLSSRHRSDNDEIELRNEPKVVRKHASSQHSKQVCEMCGQKFANRRAYGHHFKWAHPGATRTVKPVKNQRLYMCEQCGKNYQSMFALREHTHTHTGERYECDECGKRFVRKLNLMTHMKTHDGTRRTYECGVCEKHFSTYSNMRRHVQDIHMGVKKYECEACGKRFASATEIRSHIDHVHNKIPWPKRQRRRARAED